MAIFNKNELYNYNNVNAKLSNDVKNGKIKSKADNILKLKIVFKN